MAEVRVRNVGQVQDHPRPCARCNDHETPEILDRYRDTEPFRRPAARASTKIKVLSHLGFLSIEYNGYFCVPRWKRRYAHSPLLAQAVRPLTALRAPCLLRRPVASQLLASRALVASQLVRFADLAVPASWAGYCPLEITCIRTNYGYALQF